MEDIQNIILKGLLKDISIANRCLKLNYKIGQRLKVISSQTKRDMSKILYDLTYTEMILSLARLYDIPKKKYSVRCLGSLYKKIEQTNYCASINNKKELFSNLLYFGIDEQFIALLKESDNQSFNRRVIAYYRSVEGDTLSYQIKKLKEIRDKLLAHNEDIEVENAISYDLINSLLEHSKNVVSFFSLAYCGIHIKANDKYPLVSSAINWCRTYERFLND